MMVSHLLWMTSRTLRHHRIVGVDPYETVATVRCRASHCAGGMPTRREKTRVNAIELEYPTIGAINLSD
jgi:hypothetical protein